MRFIAGLFLIAVSISGMVRAEPEAASDRDGEQRGMVLDVCNNPRLFCKHRRPGRYCSDKTMEIIHCPSGHIETLGKGLFCPLLGRVPKHYHGEKPYDMFKWCEGKSGLVCPPEDSHSLGMVKCPEGLQVPCPFGQICKQHGMHCMCVNPYKPPVKDCKTEIIKDKWQDKKTTSISCKGERCATLITSEHNKLPETNYICSKTASCCSGSTATSTVSGTGCSATSTTTVTESCTSPRCRASSTCTWTTLSPCSCDRRRTSTCLCSSTRTCYWDPTASCSDYRPHSCTCDPASSCTCSATCSCPNHHTIVKTSTVWNNETCHVVDPRCTATKTLTASYVCLNYATHCIYNPRFDELMRQNIDWAERPQCDTAVVCDKWGWRGCERERVPEGCKIEMAQRSAYDHDSDDGNNDDFSGIEAVRLNNM